MDENRQAVLSARFLQAPTAGFTHSLGHVVGTSGLWDLISADVGDFNPGRVMWDLIRGDMGPNPGGCGT